MHNIKIKLSEAQMSTIYDEALYEYKTGSNIRLDSQLYPLYCYINALNSELIKLQIGLSFSMPEPECPESIEDF